MAEIPQLFRYWGSKRRMMTAIEPLVPEDSQSLVSLFVGSGAFEYNYARRHPACRVLCYDVDRAVVNFHRQALARREALLARIDGLHASLCRDGARAIGKPAYEALAAAHRGDTRHQGVLAAARFYVLAAYSFNGKVGSFAAKPSLRDPRALRAGPLPPNIQVRLGDALDVLRALVARPTPVPARTCVYADPPYFIQRPDYYAHHATAFDHGALAALLRRAHERGVAWVLSYNDVPQVRALYPGLSSLSLPVAYFSYKSAPGESAPGESAHVWRAELLVAGGAAARLISARRRRVRALFENHLHFPRDAGGLGARLLRPPPREARRAAWRRPPRSSPPSGRLAGRAPA